MSNPYGIALDREWTEWAAKIGVSPTVAAALFLISERHPSHEVMAKLTLGEGERVAAIVQRWPDCFPPGSLDALKWRSQTLAQPPSVQGLSLRAIAADAAHGILSLSPAYLSASKWRNVAAA